MVRALKQQRSLKIKAGFCANMFNPLLPLCSQSIKAQGIMIRIDFFNQSLSQSRPLGGIDFTFKHRILHPLTEIKTCPSDTTQTATSTAVFSFHVICHQHQHIAILLFPDKSGITIKIAAQMTGENLRLNMKNEPKWHILAEERMAQHLSLALRKGGQNQLSARLIEQYSAGLTLHEVRRG